VYRADFLSPVSTLNNGADRERASETVRGKQGVQSMMLSGPRRVPSLKSSGWMSFRAVNGKTEAPGERIGLRRQVDALASAGCHRSPLDTSHRAYVCIFPGSNA